MVRPAESNRPITVSHSQSPWLGLNNRLSMKPGAVHDLAVTFGTGGTEATYVSLRLVTAARSRALRALALPRLPDSSIA